MVLRFLLSDIQRRVLSHADMNAAIRSVHLVQLFLATLVSHSVLKDCQHVCLPCILIILVC